MMPRAHPEWPRCPKCGATVPPSELLPPGLYERLIALIDAGQSIQAMEAIRTHTAWDLREAKGWVLHRGSANPADRPTAPCPRCGQALRTAEARQCRHCGADWH